MNNTIFRAAIIYTGKYAGKTGCVFGKANTKDEIHKLISEQIKQSGYSIDSFKLEISVASQEELYFYMSHRFKPNYTGIIN